VPTSRSGTTTWRYLGDEDRRRTEKHGVMVSNPVIFSGPARHRWEQGRTLSPLAVPS
jgi:hypothetical protein